MAEQTHTVGAVSLSAGTWSGAGFGTAGDDLVFTRGYQHIVDDVNQSAQSAMASVVFGTLCGMDVGTAASPFITATTGTFKNANQQGTMYMAVSAADQTTMAVFEQIGNQRVYVSGSGEFTVMRQASGYVEISATHDVPTLQQFGGSSYFNAGSDGHHTLIIQGGTCRTHRSLDPATRVLITGGSLMQLNPAASTANSATIDVLGGVFDWAGGFGTNVQVNWYGGTINFGNIAIADTLAELNIFPGVHRGSSLSVVGKLTNTTVNYLAGATASTSGGGIVVGGSS